MTPTMTTRSTAALGIVVAVQLVLLVTCGAAGSPRRDEPPPSSGMFSKSDLDYYKNRVKDMFYHAYDSYIHNAYPFDELKPITCKGFDTWGSYSLTLIDSLDMLIIVGNRTEFERVVKLLTANLNFNKDINVSVFETNIRIIGGLLSAHLLSYRLYLDEHSNELNATEKLNPEWPCDGPLLRLAVNAANRILPAFNTSTGMPYGTVNLLRGVPKSETTETCVAGVGTFIVEFGTLSRLTGDPVYEQTAARALDSLWRQRSSLNLVGNHLHVDSGRWSGLDATIGSGVDSYFEYLVKGGMLLERPELIEQFRTYQRSINRFMFHGNWFFWANMNKGQKTLPLFSSLEAFYPGLLTLVGDIDQAVGLIKSYHQIWRQYGSLPEFYNIQSSSIHSNRESYPLRPELIESLMYVLRATNNDNAYFEMAVDYLEAIERISKLSCGFATVKDVKDHKLENRMESFFLAETLKYLYLIFDTESFLHNDIAASSHKLVHNRHGTCVLETGYFFFNTEAHPVDGAALECCRALRAAQQHNADEDVRVLGRLPLGKLLDRYVELKLSESRHHSVNNADDDADAEIELLADDDDDDDDVQSDHGESLSSSPKSMQHGYEQLAQHMREQSADSQQTQHTYCENERTEPLLNELDGSEHKLLCGHNYPFTCSLNDTFRVHVSNLNYLNFYP